MSLLKPKHKKPSESQFNLPARIRLPVEPSFRDLQGIKNLLQMADEKRGIHIELPWSKGVPDQQFILTVKWDSGAFTPIWTLYEETGTNSETIWSQPFPPSDMGFMYDVLSMAVGEAAAPDSKIPEDLKPLLQEEEAETQAAPDKAPSVSAYVHPSAETKAPEKSLPAQAGPAPTTPFPQPPQMGYPPIPPGYVYAPMPMAPPAGPYGAPAYMPPPSAPYSQPPTNWNFGTPPGSTASGITAKIDPTAEGSSASPSAQYEKRPGILIGSLLTEAELITEPTLDAALKIQELVKQGRLSVDRAPEILKMFFSMGASIEDYIDPSDLKPAAPGLSHGPQTQASVPQPPNKDLPHALNLLVKAGILSESDVRMAEQVCAKHGGEVKIILQAAGKFDSKTIDAALTCVDLERRGLMKVEQTIIALNYCSRSRVEFDEAMEELGWDNPRKQKRI